MIKFAFLKDQPVLTWEWLGGNRLDWRRVDKLGCYCWSLAWIRALRQMLKNGGVEGICKIVIGWGKRGKSPGCPDFWLVEPIRWWCRFSERSMSCVERRSWIVSYSLLGLRVYEQQLVVYIETELRRNQS